MLDVDKIKCVITIAETGSFAEAASRLSFSVSTVSKQIASFENDLDLVLFNRGRKSKVTPTAAGSALIPYFRNIVSAWDSMEKERKKLAARGQILRVGCSIISGYSPYDAFVDFQGKYPGCLFSQEHESIETMMEELSENELDVVIVPVLGDYQESSTKKAFDKYFNIVALPIRFSQEYVVLNKYHPLAKTDILDMAAICQYSDINFLTFHRDSEAVDTRAQVLIRKCEKWNLKPPHIHELQMDGPNVVDYALRLIDSDSINIMYSPTFCRGRNIVCRPAVDNFFTPCVMLFHNENCSEMVMSYIQSAKRIMSRETDVDITRRTDPVSSDDGISGIHTGFGIGF